VEPAPPARLAPEPPSARRALARWLLGLFGWRVEAAWPTAPKVVLIVYPHTSNWDFFIGYLARRAMGLPAIWIGKHTIFRWPVNGLLRSMGGIPVDRAHAAGVIPALLGEFERRETVCLALAPEGTRSHRDHVKRGFYRIALAAKVPVGLGFIDFATRTVGVDRWIDLTGDEASDLARLRAAYAGRVGRHPEKASELRFEPERGEEGGGGPAAPGSRTTG